MSTLRKILLNIEEIFTFVWINAVADYFCSTVSRITELSMKGILSMWMAHSHYDKWALFRTQWSPCWVYWTKCSMLLCKVIGPINASKSLKKSAGKKKKDSASEEWIFICYLSLFNRLYSLANWVRLYIPWEWKFSAGEINFKAPWFMMLQADAQQFSFQRTKQRILQLCFSLISIESW